MHYLSLESLTWSNTLVRPTHLRSSESTPVSIGFSGACGRPLENLFMKNRETRDDDDDVLASLSGLFPLTPTFKALRRFSSSKAAKNFTSSRNLRTVGAQSRVWCKRATSLSFSQFLKKFAFLKGVDILISSFRTLKVLSKQLSISVLEDVEYFLYLSVGTCWRTVRDVRGWAFLVRIFMMLKVFKIADKCYGF